MLHGVNGILFTLGLVDLFHKHSAYVCDIALFLSFYSRLQLLGILSLSFVCSVGVVKASF